MKMENCIFCKIIKGEIPSQMVFENEYCYAFHDINKQAPVHVVLVPKKHITGMNEEYLLSDTEKSALFRAIHIIAAQENIASTGYRIVSNCGQNACQSVEHFHIHILGGEKLSEKMA